MIDPLRRSRSGQPSAAESSSSSSATPGTPAAPAARGDGFRVSEAAADPVKLRDERSWIASIPQKLEGLFGQAEKAGPELLHLDAGWTPQGQGYDSARGEVLTSYYAKSGVMLSVQDKRDGKETHQVLLGGSPPPSHGGGVSTDGNRVYLADTARIYVYNRDDILRAEAGGAPVAPVSVTTVPPDTTDPATGIGLVSNGSFMAVKDGYAYVGGYSADGDGKVGAVWRYPIDPQTGALIEDGRQGPIRAPDRAQGIAVVDGALLFTTGDHKLMYQPFDSRSFQAEIGRRVDIGNGQIDPYAQGLNVIDGELWVTYESGSVKYRDKVPHPRDHIQRIPLEGLDLRAAGITPADLEG